MSMVWKAWMRDEQILLLLSLSQALAEHFVFQTLGLAPEAHGATAISTYSGVS